MAIGNLDQQTGFFPTSVLTAVLLPLETLPAISSLGGGLSMPLRTVTLRDLGEINVSNSQPRQRRRTGRWEGCFSGDTFLRRNLRGIAPGREIVRTWSN